MFFRDWSPDELDVEYFPDKQCPLAKNTKYKLFGKIIRTGSQDYGHFYAIMRWLFYYLYNNNLDKQWKD